MKTSKKLRFLGTLLSLLSFVLTLHGQKQNDFHIKGGLYATYYPEFLNDTTYKPGYNIIYPDNTGQYWSGDVCDLQLEKYRFEVNGDTLILYIKVSYELYDCRGVELESAPFHKQYFKIVDISDNIITLKFGDIIYSGQEGNSLTFSDNIYIWKRLGDYN